MSTIAPPEASAPAKTRKAGGLVRPLLIGLALAAAAYALCSVLIQAVASAPAKDPAQRQQEQLYLAEPLTA